MKSFQTRENSIFHKFSNLVLRLYDHGEYCRTESLEGITDNLPLASRYDFDRALKRLMKEFNFVHIRSENYYLNMRLVESVKKDSVEGKPVCKVKPRFYIRGLTVPDLIVPYDNFYKLQKALR
ncbi:hypothetical protein H6G54_05230 [Anabaena cylindrica FACHB-243]|uniref:Uncharacterized protein n=1 Tax=Anabaena cylindrica (strain ATCC 27899 / PCC 7122) TaxID=272123 RepID=K9ZQK6_ANACC|nr:MULTISPECIES: hypothetical protein [Anabaena]AFZ60822.1 hypothetical protein Anacy_5510 [Anabaena cylindrica PCC 7122]MBD2417122.1 hypothetical protein [Anabaena cylindrica FACHB-243]MBY5280818.1 hypothetical protein [Anabaena sp. CCAP 1446/1C]MBY5307094.1 hypothetical protein [Anabaena sp. CCAP 1446/1C]MCM2406823.1 hypothetical protein [Anabaena sp. CCAP 1446/1C]